MAINTSGYGVSPDFDQATEYARLERGDRVIIRFGTTGTQLAAVVPTRGRNKHVRCWRPSSKSWTKPRLLDPAELMRHATPADVDRLKPDYGLAWERNW